MDGPLGNIAQDIVLEVSLREVKLHPDRELNLNYFKSIDLPPTHSLIDTSHSANVATSTKVDGAKIDGFKYNF